MKIVPNAEDTKMLTLNVDSLDADARMIMQSVRYQILQWQKDEWAAAEDDDAAKADAEAAYAAATTPP